MDKKDLISSHRSNVYDNFLMHWKYIKREKVGDKWKYTYKDDAVTDARTKLGKSVIDYKKAVATENKLKADKTHDGEFSKANLDMADARVEAWQATHNAKRAVEKARKEYDAAKAKSDASIGNRIAKALNGEKSDKEVKDKGVVEKQLSNGVTYTVPYDEKLDGPIKEDTKSTKTKASDDPIKLISDMTGMKESSVKELQKLGQTDGYDSDEFKDLANTLAEGDEDTYKKIVNIIKDSNKTKGKEQKSLTEKAKSMVNTAKDKLGVDEREKYKDTKAKYDDAIDKNRDTYQEAAKAIDDYLDNPSRSTSENLDSKIRDNKFWKATVKARGEEYMAAKTEYMKTPLGTALRVKEAFDDARIETEYALDRLAKKIKKKSK